MWGSSAHQQVGPGLQVMGVRHSAQRVSIEGLCAGMAVECWVKLRV